MSCAKPMLHAHPHELPLEADLLVRTIGALGHCAQACSACADACRSEARSQSSARCIRLDLDCAATLRVLSRQHGYDALAEVCRERLLEAIG